LFPLIYQEENSAFKNSPFVLIVLSASSLVILAQHPDFPVLKGPCLGQKRPGMTPEVFAPGRYTKKPTKKASPAPFSNGPRRP
jgi:hypothetical protein